MAEILVEKLGVPAFFIANKSVMSLYGGGQMTGIAVDSGHDTTYIVPSYQVKSPQNYFMRSWNPEIVFIQDQKNLKVFFPSMSILIKQLK